MVVVVVGDIRGGGGLAQRAQPKGVLPGGGSQPERKGGPGRDHVFVGGSTRPLR